MELTITIRLIMLENKITELEFLLKFLADEPEFSQEHIIVQRQELRDDLKMYPGL